MIKKYSLLQKQSGRVKEKLLDIYEKQVPLADREKYTFEEWWNETMPDSHSANYFDVPVKTWDKQYHEESQPWHIDHNFYNVPETIGKKEDKND